MPPAACKGKPPPAQRRLPSEPSPASRRSPASHVGALRVISATLANPHNVRSRAVLKADWPCWLGVHIGGSCDLCGLRLVTSCGGLIAAVSFSVRLAGSQAARRNDRGLPGI